MFAMSMPAIPRTLVEITPAWLTNALREHGCLAEATVQAVAAQSVGAEFGFLDCLARLRLTYDRIENGAPASVIVKLPTADELHRNIGNFYSAYEREIRFYREVAPHSPIRVPRTFCLAMDREADAYLLVMEDLGSLTPGDQVQGLTADEAHAGVEAIGRFHATWWESPRLATLDWMPTRNFRAARYQSMWPKFRETIGPQLSPAAVALGERLNERLESLLQKIEAGPRTIVHSDFRADNLLFDGPSVAVLDWQLAIRSHGALDVARLLCGSLPSGDRARREAELVRHWHDALAAGGVKDYSFQQAFEDYRLAAFLCLYYPVTIHEAEEAGGRRGTALAHAQIERFFTAALELEVAALIVKS
jgi:aminoglycoside phosphotransferase (APT) family kinase protein